MCVPARASGVREHEQTSSSVPKGLWRGMSIPGWVQFYLSQHKGPVPFHDLLAALDQNGVELGKKEKPKRFGANLKTAIVSNRKGFRYDRSHDTVELLVRGARTT